MPTGRARRLQRTCERTASKQPPPHATTQGATLVAGTQDAKLHAGDMDRTYKAIQREVGNFEAHLTVAAAKLWRVRPVVDFLFPEVPASACSTFTMTSTKTLDEIVALSDYKLVGLNFPDR
jgi:hypothetical protein